MKVLRFLIAFALGLTVLSTISSAADSQSTSILPFSTKDYYLNYNAIYHGAPMNEWDARQKADRNGKLSKNEGVNLDGTLTAAYLFAPGVGVGPAIPFLLMPSVGENFHLGDVGIKAFNSKIIDLDNFSASASFTAQAATDEFSKARGMKYGLKATPSAKYLVPNTALVVGSLTEAKYYGAVTKGKNWKLWAQPYVSYLISKKVALNLAYESEWNHNINQPTNNLGLVQRDFQPGVIWFVNKAITVKPYFQAFVTNGHMTWATTALGAYISATAI